MHLETLGTDLEVFLKEEDTIISAEGKVGGTKKNPKSLDRGVSVQEDNMMAEFNVVPADDPKQFRDNIKDALDQLVDLVDPLSLDLSGSHSFIGRELFTEQAQEFGCEPEEDAWGISDDQPPDPSQEIRSCGGHIHLGYLDPEDDKEKIINSRIIITKLLDLYIGVPSIILGDDSDRIRTDLYGEPGKFRAKDYGLEYRTVSNFWIRKGSYMEWVFKQARLAVDMADIHMNKSDSLDPISNYQAKKVKEAISGFDKELASEIIESFKIEIPKDVKEEKEVYTVPS